MHQKITQCIKNKKNTDKEGSIDKRSSEPDSDVTQMQELSDNKFKIGMINMLRAPVEILDNIQEQMGKVNRVIESLRKNQKEMLDIKTVTEMENAFDGLISRLIMAEDGICELEHGST